MFVTRARKADLPTDPPANLPAYLPTHPRLFSKALGYTNLINIAMTDAVDNIPRSGLVVTCDLVISDAYAILRPVYEAVWSLIVHTESKVWPSSVLFLSSALPTGRQFA